MKRDGRAVRDGPHDRRGARAQPPGATTRATATRSTCWARPRSPPPTPRATATRTRAAIAAIGASVAGRDVPMSSRSRRSRSSCPRCIRATSSRSASACWPSSCPRSSTLARGARATRGIGMTIDAEEADRLELSLEIFARAAPRCRARRLGRASASRCRRTRSARGAVVEWVAALARDTRHAHPGAAGQGRVLGHRDQARAGAGPRRAIRCSRARRTPTSPTSRARARCSRRGDARLSDVRDAQRAHDRVGRGVRAAARRDSTFEFQRLHGMGEALYDAGDRARRATSRAASTRRSGAHQDLLPYLVRRLLENGANTSFVNRIADPAGRRRRRRRRSGGEARARTTTRRAAAPAAAARPVRAERAQLRRRRSLADQDAMAALDARCARGRSADWVAAPMLSRQHARRARRATSLDPADRRRQHRHASIDADAATVDRALSTRSSPASRRGTRAAARRAPRCSSAPPTLFERDARRVRRAAARAKPARRARCASPRCARRSTSAATTRRARARDFARPLALPSPDRRGEHAGAARPRRVRAASRRGIFRWRSSRARSPRRSPPATRSPRSPPSRRR